MIIGCRSENRSRSDTSLKKKRSQASDKQCDFFVGSDRTATFIVVLVLSCFALFCFVSFVCLFVCLFVFLCGCGFASARLKRQLVCMSCVSLSRPLSSTAVPSICSCSHVTRPSFCCFFTALLFVSAQMMANPWRRSRARHW